MQRSGERLVDLEQRLTSGEHDEAASAALAPTAFDLVRQRVRRRKASAAWPRSADKVRIAEVAGSVGPVLLSARP